jgi:hypothetical protein
MVYLNLFLKNHNSHTQDLYGRETIFQSSFFGLLKLVVLTFAEWSRRALGPVGEQLVLGNTTKMASLVALWGRLSGEPVKACNDDASAFAEVKRDVDSEQAAAADKVPDDNENITETFGFVVLSFLTPGHDAGGDLNVLSLLPHIKAAMAPLSLSAATTSRHPQTAQQLLDLAQWRYGRTEAGRAMRVGKAERENFWRLAAAGVPTEAALAAIPPSTCFTPYVPIPKDEEDLVDVGQFGLAEGMIVAHVVVAFLRDTRVLDTAAAQALRQQGQAALTVPPEIRAFAQDQADARKAKLGVGHPAWKWLSSKTPADMSPGFASTDILV